MALVQIGTIHTPFKRAAGTPLQTAFEPDTQGKVEIFTQYAEGLTGLEGFERVWLLYWFDRGVTARLRVIPFRDNVERGVFATRAPCRPNPIALSCVRVLNIQRNTLTIAGVDMVDGTPLLDIKPYVPEYDAVPNAKAGWLDSPHVHRTHADDRFDPDGTK